MDFFDKLGKKASEAYKATADKTGKLARETKIKMRIGELKGQINDIYEEIGKKVYEKHTREENISIKDDLEEQCTKIDVLSDEIESLLKESLELKNKKQCSNCYKEVEKDAKFCPNCGTEQREEPIVKEIEVVAEQEETKEKEESQELLEEQKEKDESLEISEESKEKDESQEASEQPKENDEPIEIQAKPEEIIQEEVGQQKEEKTEERENTEIEQENKE